jgi:hypothetical protein
VRVSSFRAASAVMPKRSPISEKRSRSSNRKRNSSAISPGRRAAERRSRSSVSRRIASSLGDSGADRPANPLAWPKVPAAVYPAGR